MIKVQGQISDFNKEQPKDKIKSSNFYLTINTNQSYKKNAQYLQSDTEYFENVIKEFLQNLDKYAILPEGQTWNENLIKNCDIDYIIEKGTKKGFLHCHALVKINHITNVKLDFKKIKTHIQDSLQLKNIYFKSYMSKNNEQNILQYLDKFTK